MFDPPPKGVKTKSGDLLVLYYYIRSRINIQLQRYYNFPLSYFLLEYQRTEKNSNRGSYTVSHT